MPSWVAITALAGVLLGGGGLAGYFGVRLTNRTTRESAFIDDQAAKIAALEASVETLQGQMLAVQGRAMVGADYIEVLRLHISERREPPPPPYPSALTGGTA